MGLRANLRAGGAKGSSRVFPPQFSLMNEVLSHPHFSEPTCPRESVEGQVLVLGMDSAANSSASAAVLIPVRPPVGAETENLGKRQRKAKEKTTLFRLPEQLALPSSGY